VTKSCESENFHSKLSIRRNKKENFKLERRKTQQKEEEDLKGKFSLER
jgi:hypothetical protein